MRVLSWLLTSATGFTVVLSPQIPCVPNNRWSVKATLIKARTCSSPFFQVAFSSPDLSSYLVHSFLEQPSSSSLLLYVYSTLHSSLVLLVVFSPVRLSPLHWITATVNSHLSSVGMPFIAPSFFSLSLSLHFPLSSHLHSS